jgi:hypothetical protein
MSEPFECFVRKTRELGLHADCGGLSSASDYGQGWGHLQVGILRYATGGTVISKNGKVRLRERVARLGVYSLVSLQAVRAKAPKSPWATP